MKKVVIAEPGTSNIKIVRDATIPVPKSDEIRIKVTAAGVSQSDIMVARGAFPAGQPKFPFTPGFDCIGIVDEIGQDVKKYKVGDLVSALDVYGAWSEYVCYSETNSAKSVVVKVRTDIDPTQSISIILSYMTAYEMLNRAISLGPKFYQFQMFN
jgi:NADPH2:quinone reductase